MRRGAPIAFVVAACFVARPGSAFVTPTFRATPIDIAGEYEVTGTDIGGGAGETNVRGTISRLGDGLYRIVEHGQGEYECLCIRTGDHLGCAWAAVGTPIVLASYVAHGPTLEGRFYDGNVAFNETLSSPNGAQSPATVFQSPVPTAGTTPATTFAIAPVGAASPKVYAASRLETVSNLMRSGWSILDGEHLDVGFGPGVGVVVYTIEGGGRVLRGVWMDSGRPYGGTGIDVLTRI